MNESLKKLAEQFWIEARRQGLVVEYLHFDIATSVDGNYNLVGQSVDAKLTENKEA